MKNVVLFLCSIMVSITLFSQQKDFEGIVAYKADVISKVDGISNKAFLRSFLEADSNITTIKQGNYKISSSLGDFYYLTKKERLYMKFKGVDTLFYLDYNSDSTLVRKILRPRDQKKIAGYDCKPLTIETEGTTRTYYYAPALYMNPEYDKNNKLANFNVYAKEAAAVWLSVIDENDSFRYTKTCTRVQQFPVNDSVFMLPALPERQFVIEAIITPPGFRGKDGWGSYLAKNLDPEIGKKYVKIRRGETSATETVLVTFLISDKGRVLATQVMNKKEVHPKLAEEALRVINASPLWKPATIFGEKVAFRFNQPVSFQTSIK